EDGADGPPQGVDGLLGRVLGIGRHVEDLAAALGPPVEPEAVDEEPTPGMDPQIGLAGRGAEEDPDLVEALQDAVDGPALGGPLAQDAGELAACGRPDTTAGGGGGVEVDVIDAALTEPVGQLLDGHGVVVGGLVDGVVVAEDGEDPADA